MEVEYKKIEAKNNLNIQFDYEKGEIRLFGTRITLANLHLCCKKIDKMFGTGGEVIVNLMAFEQGSQLFEAMKTNSPDKSKEALLNEVVEIQQQSGWGITSLKIISDNRPKVEVTVENPPVKTVHGSSKHLIGAFWAGVLSRYFGQKLKCTGFSYDEKEDEFRCTVTA